MGGGGAVKISRIDFVFLDPPPYPAAGSATEGRLLSLFHFHAVHIPKMPYTTSLIGVQ